MAYESVYLDQRIDVENCTQNWIFLYIFTNLLVTILIIWISTNFVTIG